MSTAETKMNLVKQVASVRPNVSNDAQQLKVLCERLLREQPQSGPLLQRLLARSRRMGRRCAFAPIQDRRCSACNMTVASAQIQKARAGEFINCAHCAIFLYHDQR
jgi:predicted  nucleic acid-binding Zn-ribbon protein